MAGQTSATGQLKGTVTGRQLDFSFEYSDPHFSTMIMTDSGSALITDNDMTGNEAIEEYIGAYNCTYRFTLTKQ
jgi:hypothetical protein